MNAPAFLLLYAVVAGIGMPAWIATSGGGRGSPRTGIALWLGAIAGATAAVSIVIALWVVPASGLHESMSMSLGVCAHAVRVLYDGASGWMGAAVALLATGLTSRISWSSVRMARDARRERRRQHRILSMVGDPLRPGTVVVDHPAASVYCVPDGLWRATGTVVITSTALETLTGPELDAVLAHERAHLRSRHHLIVGLSEALANAVPRLVGWKAASSSIRALVEMAADDVARERHSGDVLARAVLRLTSDPMPRTALGAAGSVGSARLARLLGNERAPSRDAAVSTALMVALAMAPLVLALTPAVNPAAHGLCPF